VAGARNTPRGEHVHGVLEELLFALRGGDRYGISRMPTAET
jgi:hypothetical protein